MLDELITSVDASDDFKAGPRSLNPLQPEAEVEVERLEEEFNSLESEIAQIGKKVEGFNYTSEQDSGEQAVVENIKNELSESFMQARSLFEDHYVTLPDEKYDIFESMVAKLDDMEDKLNEQIEANVALASSMSGFQRQSVLADVSWDLSETGKEKMAGLAESVEFESEESFRQNRNPQGICLHNRKLLNPKVNTLKNPLALAPSRKVCLHGCYAKPLVELSSEINYSKSVTQNV